MTLHHLGNVVAIVEPARRGRPLAKPSVREWAEFGQKLINNMNAHNKKVRGNKKDIIYAISTGINILNSTDDEILKKEVRQDLNRLSYSLGGYWKQWLDHLCHEKHKEKEKRKRITVTFNIIDNFDALFDGDEFNGRNMEDLQRAIASLGIRKLADIYEISSFLSDYYPKSEELKKYDGFDTSKSEGHALVSILELRRLFRGADSASFESLKSFFYSRRDKVSKIDRFELIKKLIMGYSKGDVEAEKLIDEIRMIVSNNYL